MVDRRNEDPWRRSLVSSPLIKALRDPDRTVVCVLNAPGRARRLACRSCRALQRCERCQATVAQTHDGLLRCARCGTERPVVCQVCGSARWSCCDPGVSGLRDELEAAAGRPVVEVTGESAEEASEASASVFVGTEAVLHRVPRADVVAFLEDIDDELLAPRFRADEQALVLLAGAARLLGPAATAGGCWYRPACLTTRCSTPSSTPTPAASRVRRWPGGASSASPAHALAVVSGAGAEELADTLRGDPAVSVAGPADGRYLVRAAEPDALGNALAAAPDPRLESASSSATPRWWPTPSPSPIRPAATPWGS